MEKVNLSHWCKYEAVSIEHKMQTIFNCNFLGFDALVNSDFIKDNPFTAMVATLTAIYNNKDSIQKESINNFIDTNSIYSKLSIYDIVSEYGKKVFESICTEWEKLL